MKTLLPFLLLVAGHLAAQPTWCNPLDINYQYNFEQLNDNISYRSGADPVIIHHKGEYYLFATISGGYWHSSDLLHWRYIRPLRWPFEDNCAPAAWSIGDTLLLFQSAVDPRPILYSTKPETGELHFYNRWLPRLPDGVIGPWDPALFHDTRSGRWFMYFGSSNLYPVYGIELDPAKRLAYKGKAKELIYLHPAEHGWERFGPNHTDTIKPFVEGAWMTEHGGKYYLQYGAPGTEYNVYANGTYVAEDPMGPFTYAPYNPVSYKPGGFVVGAGHGNTFQDKHGNFWNTGTPWVAVNWNFERRIAMFPAGFDADGQMFSHTRFGDFPQYLPDGKWSSPEDLFTGWMLLSYRKPAMASSTRDTFNASRVTDENPRSYWVAGSARPGEWLQVDLQRNCTLRALQINYTDYQSGVFASDSSVYTQFRLWHSTDGLHWDTLANQWNSRRDRPNAYLELPRPVKARFVRFEHRYVGARHLAISDIRVFGNAGGPLPGTPADFRVQRQSDGRNATVRWAPVLGAVGYNIRWGIAPDKLYQCWQVWADAGNTVDIRALNLGQTYFFAIEAFNENGVSALSEVLEGRE
ncbi:MAG: family 43 glycosylhydrolase [Saprospiraceae bacterium]|nr:family 43 glycosylhydrolase [Saprospiraceae bacterium]